MSLNREQQLRINALTNILKIREDELLKVKGPCRWKEKGCRLHYAHSGPCYLTGVVDPMLQAETSVSSTTTIDLGKAPDRYEALLNSLREDLEASGSSWRFTRDHYKALLDSIAEVKAKQSKPDRSSLTAVIDALILEADSQQMIDATTNNRQASHNAVMLRNMAYRLRRCFGNDEG